MRKESKQLIGTDEAGYGPNLGPLVVSATAWNAEDENRLDDFVADLESASIFLGDSKKIYHSGGSLAPLETVVLGALHSLKTAPKTDRELFQTLGDFALDGPALPEIAILLPVDAAEENILETSRRFRQARKRFGVELTAIRSRIVFPGEFNRLLDRFDSKGALLSDCTLRLALSDGLIRDGDVRVLCDKHGGRNRYLDLLHGFFPDEMIWTERESRESSVYCISGPERSFEFQFIAKGESRVPVALASMISKYVRELAMLRFNRFWQSRVPGLRPTAGYPEDAGRFKQDLLAAGQDFEEESFWRKK